MALLTMFTSCDCNNYPDVPISVKVDSRIPEYQRPVAHVTRTEATDRYFPCQAIIDGQPVTRLNAAGTTLLNMPEQDIYLPRLAPGKHEIEFVFGHARRLYRDAEAACGERDKSQRMTIEVLPSQKHVLALTFPRTDVDCYLFMPDDGIAINCTNKTEFPISELAVLPACYAVGVYPFSSQVGGVEIKKVGERLSVVRTDTLIGDGIDIRMEGTLEEGKPNSRFCLRAGGLDYEIQVMN